MENRSCLLCLTKPCQQYFTDVKRCYRQCPTCRLTFVPPSQRLSAQEEKKRYDLHENDSSDLGYRAFLSQLADPLCKFLKPGEIGLDFGCGPGPTLSVMLKEQGFDCHDYDPIYFNDRSLLENKYDFITASEVFEHFYNPHQDIQRLVNLLKPQGKLAIMTGIFEEEQDFSKWHYIREDTHVCFYKKETFNWIENNLPLKKIYQNKNVYVFKYSA